MKKIFSLFVIIGTICCLLSGCSEKKSETVRYELSPIYDEIYVMKYRVSSAAPALNYDVADYCVNDSVYTVKGTVQIKYTDDTPYMLYTESNYTYSDTVVCYVPKDGVEYQNNVGLK